MDVSLVGEGGGGGIFIGECGGEVGGVRIPSCRGSANSVPSTPVATTSARDHLTLVLGACGYLKQASVAESIHTTEQRNRNNYTLIKLNNTRGKF